jgi:hypothetical protein
LKAKQLFPNNALLGARLDSQASQGGSELPEISQALETGRCKLIVRELFLQAAYFFVAAHDQAFS